ncbi:hypothetical protein NKH18_07085 [Streptomyces sp. M10(2022)]
MMTMAERMRMAERRSGSSLGRQIARDSRASMGRFQAFSIMAVAWSSAVVLDMSGSTWSRRGRVRQRAYPERAACEAGSERGDGVTGRAAAVVGTTVERDLAAWTRWMSREWACAV